MIQATQAKRQQTATQYADIQVLLEGFMWTRTNLVHLQSHPYVISMPQISCLYKQNT